MGHVRFARETQLALVALVGEDVGLFYQIRHVLGQIGGDPVDEGLRCDCDCHHLAYPVYPDDIIGHSNCPDGPRIDFEAFYPLGGGIATFPLPDFRSLRGRGWSNQRRPLRSQRVFDLRESSSGEMRFLFHIGTERGAVVSIPEEVTGTVRKEPDAGDYLTPFPTFRKYSTFCCNPSSIST